MIHSKLSRWSVSGLLTCTLAFLGGWSTPSFSQSAVPPTSRAEVANPTRFASLNVPGPMTCTQSVSRCAWRVLRAMDIPRPSGTSSSREEVFTFGNGVVIFLYTQADLEDDALAAERYRVAFRQSGQTLRLVQVGRQQRCARSRTGWTKRLCP